ncbi:hypothetical protein ACHAXS_000031, partial [Conticribra weissflogii]
MNTAPIGYIFLSREDCCERHFSWRYDLCMGKDPNDSHSQLFYPDWEGTNRGCLNDGKEPLYMRSNRDIWLHETLQECCEMNYPFMLDDCMGVKATATGGFSPSSLSRFYYPDWENSDTFCVNDGNEPQYMKNSPDIWMFPTLSE